MTKHTPATPLPWSAARMIEGRNKRIKDQTAELIRLQSEHRRLVEALRMAEQRLSALMRHEDYAPHANIIARDTARALLAELGECSTKG